MLRFDVIHSLLHNSRAIPLILLLGAGLASARPDAAGIEFFETRVRPVLAASCYECHGPDKQSSDLRLDSPQAILRGGERGAAIAAGDPEGSRLIRAIRYTDEELAMPPKEKLTESDIEALVRWVEMGAPLPVSEGSASEGAEVDYPETSAFDLAGRRDAHWAFRPLEEVAPARVKNAGWVVNPVDAFILARLEDQGLEPAAAADPRSLLRRLYFDLTGLPPSVEALEAFVSDDSPAAYERSVDSLLASPHFGERWARHWLDLVRYAESKGHEYDFVIPNSYQYRDYVIRALNADLPYDSFVTEHVAGDLLDPPRTHSEQGFDESVLATGFWFFGEQPHSPVDVRADEIERVANQIDVFSKTFLGLTVACARCHDHKFDAISSEDYYSLAGFAMSSSYRQVRFETREHNRRVAEELWAFDAEHRADVVRAVGSALETDLENLSERLLAAREALLLDEASLPVPDEVPEGMNLLFEDFEADGYGEWAVTGTAFGEGPAPIDELPNYQGDVRARGKSCVNSHPDQDIEEGDAHVGTLTSPSFPIERDYIHFLISGGEYPGECGIELRVDGEAVRSASGSNGHTLLPGSFEVSELRGKTGELRIFDQSGGIGAYVGLDQVVFSDQSEAAALDIERKPLQEVAWRAALDRVAAEHGLGGASLIPAWMQAIERARGNASHPLHFWAVLACKEDRGQEFPRAERDALIEGVHARAADWATLQSGLEAIVDYGSAGVSAAGGKVWIQDGVSFGPGPSRTGDVRLGSSRARPIEHVFDYAAARYDPAWNVLELDPETQREAGRLDWVQSGRTLRTPTFSLDSPRIYYCVKGSGKAYAAVDSHRMNYGPLHGALTKSWDAGSGWQWVAHDLEDYVGHRLHIEFTPTPLPQDSDRETGPDGLAVAVVCTSIVPPETIQQPNALLSDALANARSIEGLAQVYEDLLAMAARRMRGDRLSGSVDSVEVARLCDWLVTHPELTEIDLSGAGLEPFFTRRAEILAKIRSTSRTAPAMLDGSGFDEHRLIRGSHHSPGEPAPRRFLEAIAGDAQLPIAHGSGRLELARRLTDPENPFLARVRVNRLFHHLYGRGLVSSVDNFGVTGDRPTHPELLDYLATRFVDESWSTKSMIRFLVTSNAYRMSTQADPEAEERDPKNLLRHHMPVRRLEGEAIRDAILAISGSLDPTLFGPSIDVRLTPFMGGRGMPPSGPLDGAGRRSIYLSVRRNFLSPFFLTFDFPVPATTTGRRTASNVPAQALALMNDPFVAQEAERWAKMVLEGPQGSAEDRVSLLYRAAFGRSPEPDEMTAALAFVEDQGRETGEGEAREERDQATWSNLCHVLFNVKEFFFLN